MAMEKSDAFIRVGDWVRLREPDAGCRYGQVVSVDGRTVCIQTDAFNKLTCLAYEITGPLDRFDPPHPYFPMRKKLPYGRYNCSDGSHVLFNRDYEPLCRVQPDGTFSVCDPEDRIKHDSREFFYTEGYEPWRNRPAFDASASQLPIKLQQCAVDALVNSYLTKAGADLVDEFMQHAQMEKTADYLRRGRRFASLTLGEANDFWVTVFADLTKDEMRGRVLEARQLEMRDIDAELGLRNARPPYDRVEYLLPRVRALIERGAMSEGFRIQVANFLAERRGPRH